VATPVGTADCDDGVAVNGWPNTVKFALSFIPLFIVTVRGLELLFTVPVKPMNW
jgi:hypothetical protein